MNTNYIIIGALSLLSLLGLGVIQNILEEKDLFKNTLNILSYILSGLYLGIKLALKIAIIASIISIISITVLIIISGKTTLTSAVMTVMSFVGIYTILHTVYALIYQDSFGWLFCIPDLINMLEKEKSK